MMQTSKQKISLYLYGSQHSGAADGHSDVDIMVVTEKKTRFDRAQIVERIKIAYPSWKNKKIDLKFVTIEPDPSQKAYLKAHLKHASRLLSGPDIRDQVSLGTYADAIKSTHLRLHEFLSKFKIKSDVDFIKIMMRSHTLKNLHRCIFHISLINQMLKDKTLLYKENQIRLESFIKMNEDLKVRWQLKRPVDQASRERLRKYIVGTAIVLSGMRLLSKSAPINKNAA